MTEATIQQWFEEKEIIESDFERGLISLEIRQQIEGRLNWLTEQLDFADQAIGVEDRCEDKLANDEALIMSLSKPLKPAYFGRVVRGRILSWVRRVWLGMSYMRRSTWSNTVTDITA